MKKFSWAVASALTLSMAHASVHLDLDSIDRAWEGISDPSRMSSSFERGMANLPLSGQGADPEKYWSSDYWARNKGGINYRWNSSHPTGFNLKSPTKTQASQMSIAELSALAPSEKFDLLSGRYTYPLKNQIAAYASPNRSSWEGICDGWAAAALNHDEPTPKTFANPDGILIPFGSSDVKALLSWYYARVWSGGYAMMGRRCNGGINIGTDRCNNDMNAGAFHIVLANRLGKQGLPFIADIDRGSQVWNHIGWDFHSTIVSTGGRRSTSASGTVKTMRVKTSVKYIYLVPKNSWNPVIGTSSQRTTTRNYEYYVDLNSAGNIIGGDWISTQRPDFLWLERKTSGFTGSWARLADLVNDNDVNEVSDMPEAPIDPAIDLEVRDEELE